jgi:hypothetical protein
VTAEDLLARERFWPYQVELVEAWAPAGSAALPAGSTGVLVRVEPSGRARIDFGRDGLHEVPAALTDLAWRAERVRRGELEKTAPNFVLAIGPRLLDAGAPALRPFAWERALEGRRFLAVFADPAAEELRDLAEALAPLREQPGVLTILFPQGEHADARVRERLRSLGWPVPFVYDHLSEPYTRSLLGEGVRPPAVVLQTAEGRVILAGTWEAGTASRLRAALGDGNVPGR